MPGFLDDDPLRAAFTEYKSTTPTRPPGAAAAYADLKQRQRFRAVLVTAIAVVLVVLSLTRIGSNEALPPVDPSPSMTPSFAPDPAPFPTHVVRTNDPPSDAMTYADLSEAEFAVPLALDQCGSGLLRFGNGVADGNRIVAVAMVDIERDSRWEAVVLLECEHSAIDAPAQQLIVVGRDAGGTIATYGLVVATTDGIKQIDHVWGTTGGGIEVIVRDMVFCCARRYTDIQHQWRNYAWDGSRFVQTAGATGFHAQESNVDLTVTVSDLVFGPPADGKRQGEVELTVTNVGSVYVDRVVAITLTRNVELDGLAVWQGTRELNLPQIRMLPLAPGESQTVRLSVATTQADPRLIDLRIAAAALGAEEAWLRDANPVDNEGTDQLAGIPVTIRFS